LHIALAPIPPQTHQQPAPPTHQSLHAPDLMQPMPSHPPMPPAVGTPPPSSPTGPTQLSSTTRQHRFVTTPQATSLNGANYALTHFSLPFGTPPTQTSLAASAKASALVPTMASASKAPTPSSPSNTTKSPLIAGRKSPTLRLSVKSDPRKAALSTKLASPLVATTLHTPEMLALS
jgi:hypothetical protein